MCRRRFTEVLAFVAITGCRAWRGELGIKSEHECVEKKCTSEEPTEHKQCVDACHRRFKP
jgi:hypothetical protein